MRKSLKMYCNRKKTEVKNISVVYFLCLLSLYFCEELHCELLVGWWVGAQQAHPWYPALRPVLHPRLSYRQRPQRQGTGFSLLSSFILCVQPPACTFYSSEPVFVNLLRSPGIDSPHSGPVQQPYLSY